MNNKLFKKIVGSMGYKLVDKNLIKNNRLIAQKSILNLDLILNKIFNSQKINSLIQIGANNGDRFDDLNKYIKKHKVFCVLVEPINIYFEELKENYKNLENIYFEKSAISINNNDNNIYTVDEKYLEKYDEHIHGISSFKKNHLIKHGVKSNHIISQNINCITIIELFKKYKINALDLLFVDAEGYDGNIILDFLNKSELEPIIIFEFIHIDFIIFKKLIDKLLYKKYNYFSVNENLICFTKKINNFL